MVPVTSGTHFNQQYKTWNIVSFNNTNIKLLLSWLTMLVLLGTVIIDMISNVWDTFEALGNLTYNDNIAILNQSEQGVQQKNVSLKNTPPPLLVH